MATSGRNRRLEPCSKQPGGVDGFCGVIAEVEVTTGAANEGDHILDRLDTAAATMGEPIGVATADAGYAYAKVFGGLKARGIDAIIRPRPNRSEARARSAGSSSMRAMIW